MSISKYGKHMQNSLLKLLSVVHIIVLFSYSSDFKARREYVPKALTEHIQSAKEGRSVKNQPTST